jgi:hypothetical protein
MQAIAIGTRVDQTKNQSFRYAHVGERWKSVWKCQIEVPCVLCQVQLLACCIQKIDELKKRVLMRDATPPLEVLHTQD